MKSIEHRLQQLEARIKPSDVPPPDPRKSEDEWFARAGLTRADVISKYGSIPNFAYSQMKGVDHLGNDLPGRKQADLESEARLKREGRTAREALMEMLRVGRS